MSDSQYNIMMYVMHVVRLDVLSFSCATTYLFWYTFNSSPMCGTSQLGIWPR
eukprot:COSAG01_NODE_10721_length_2095_cov_1.423848_1_plen_52_part_00